jgi:cell division septation protein DedD
MTIIPPEVAVKDKKRIPLVWIPATLTIGLLIAAVYLGGRIVAAHRPAKAVARVTNNVRRTAPSQPAVAQPVAAPSVVPPAVVAPALEPEIKPEPSVKAASPAATVATDNAVPTITPHDGERYIQLGAFNVEATRRFVQHLRSEKLEPRVAPGPRPEIMRVLIGPFDNLDALKQRKAQLQTEGFDTFVRAY